MIEIGKIVVQTIEDAFNQVRRGSEIERLENLVILVPSHYTSHVRDYMIDLYDKTYEGAYSDAAKGVHARSIEVDYMYTWVGCKVFPGYEDAVVIFGKDWLLMGKEPIKLRLDHRTHNRNVGSYAEALKKKGL